MNRVVDALRLLVAPEGDLSPSWTKLHGLRALATDGEYSGCTITVEVPGSEIVLFAIEGTPAGGGGAVCWEASATDDRGVREWLVSLGLASTAADRLEPRT